jgi:hypothetical protein
MMCHELSLSLSFGPDINKDKALMQLPSPDPYQQSWFCNLTQ